MDGWGLGLGVLGGVDTDEDGIYIYTGGDGMDTGGGVYRGLVSISGDLFAGGYDGSDAGGGISGA